MDAELQKLLLKKAGALLARRSYSRGELGDKLARYAEGSQVEPVLDRLEQLNLLNDADYAYNFALCRIQEGWAPAKVHSSLLRRKIGQKTVERALERAQSEPASESSLASFVQMHCRKKGLPASPREVRRLISYLLRRGYDEETVLDTLRQTLPQTVWNRFDTGE